MEVDLGSVLPLNSIVRDFLAIQLLGVHLLVGGHGFDLDLVSKIPMLQGSWAGV